MSNLELHAISEVNWTGELPAGVAPLKVYIGPDTVGLGGFQVALAEVIATPTRQLMMALHAARRERE